MSAKETGPHLNPVVSAPNKILDSKIAGTAGIVYPPGHGLIDKIKPLGYASLVVSQPYAQQNAVSEDFAFDDTET
ncbi:MAG: hypothetical protein Q7S13_05970 [Candidatus Omnitrophota bacterium]|nr:hypothetical protein [Candidatus Omnitrophota bacterium]